MTSRAILLSVKPQYANTLVDGLKTIELRKSFPADMPNGTKLYIYSSSPQKVVIGECEIAVVEKLPIEALWQRSISEAMISWEEFEQYYQGHAHGVAITVQKPRRYSSPIKLQDFTLRKITVPPQSFQYLDPEQVAMR